MNILHYTTYSKGGAALAALRIHSGLALTNISSEVSVLYKDDSTINEGVHDFREPYGFFKNLKLKMANKKMVNTQNSIITQNGKQREMFSFLNTVWDIRQDTFYDQADIIHFHWVSGFLNFSDFFQKNKKPVLFTLHDHFPFSGGFHYLFGVNETGYKEIIDHQNNQWQKILTNDNLFFATPSQYLSNYVKSFNVPQSRVRVIANPVNPLFFSSIDRNKSQQMLGLSSEYRYILFVSDHIDYPRKGFDQLVALAPHLPPDVKILVVGGNPGKHVSFLQQSNVVWLGPMDFEMQMNSLYNSSSLLVNPSMDDIYSNTILEASFCGIPSICYKHSGIQETVNPGINGVYFSSFKPEQMAEDIIAALQKEWDKNAMMEHISQQHSIMPVAEKYKDYYQFILDSK